MAVKNLNPSLSDYRSCILDRRPRKPLVEHAPQQMGARLLQTDATLSISLKENGSGHHDTCSASSVRSHGVMRGRSQGAPAQRVSGPSPCLSWISSSSLEVSDSDPAPCSWWQTPAHRPCYSPRCLPGPSHSGLQKVKPLPLFPGLCPCCALCKDVLSQLQIFTGLTPTTEASTPLSSSLGAPSQPCPLNLPPAPVSITLLFPEHSQGQTSSCLFTCLLLFLPTVSPSIQSSSASQCPINDSRKHK